jgi:vesicle coat complex subunit
MGIFGPPDVEKLKNKRDVKGLIGALRYRKNSTICKNAALALADLFATSPGEHASQAVSSLIELLDDADVGVVSSAVLALGAVGQPALLPLVSVLRSPKERVREAAARTIGRLAPNLPDPTYLKLAIDPLIGLLRDSNPTIRRSAAWALGRASQRVEPATRSLPVENLIRALRDPNTEVREAAAAALGRIGEGRAIRPLVASLTDESGVIRKVAAEALNGLGWKATLPVEMIIYAIACQDWENPILRSPAAASSLISVMGSTDESARVNVIRCLGKARSS